MARLSLRGQRVLVTGASAGLGAEFALQLARDHGAHPVLVARRRDRLEALAEQLKAHGVAPEIAPADLSRDSNVAALLDTVDTDAAPLGAAILNAGVTHFGHAVDQPWEGALGLLATNVLAPVRLASELSRRFKARPAGGAVMLVSSLAGFAPLPWQALYGGSKALVTSFGIALNHELRGSAASVTVFAPGGIATEMLSAMGGAFKQGDLGIMDADACARIALEGFIARRDVVVPGALNKLNAWAMQVGPRSMVLDSVSRIYRDALARLPG